MKASESVAKLWLASKRAEHYALEMLFDLSLLINQIHKMIHYLQLERGASVLFLVNDGEVLNDIDYREYRSAFCVKRTEFNESLDKWLQASEGKILGGGVYVNLAKALNVLEKDLFTVRRDVDARQVSSIQCAKEIGRIIQVLMNVIVDMAELTQQPVISKLMVSLIYIMKAKELSGQERAIGVYLAVSATKDQQLEDERLGLIELQDYYFDLFEEVAASEALGQLSEVRSFLDIDDKRQLFIKKQVVGLNDARAWFKTCTQRIEMIQFIEESLLQNLQVLCAKQLNHSDEILDKDEQWLDAVIGQDVSVFGVNASSISILMEKLTNQGRDLKVAQEELSNTKQAMLDQKVIQLAKSRMIKRFKISEEAAHRQLQKAAMEQGVRLVDLANQIISQSSSHKI